MSGLSEARDLLQKLKKSVSQGDTRQGKSTLTQLKLQLVKQPGLQPKYTPSPEALEARQLARDALEQAVLLSVKDKDDKAVEHNYQQLRTYYADQRSPSSLEHKIRGLFLLHLLVHNRIAEFHTQVELIPAKAQQTPEIAHVIQLEQWMMEGAYNKVLDAGNSPADADYKSYLTQLQETVRQEVADCSESAYAKLKVSEAKALLMYTSESELLSHAAQANWIVDGGSITFRKEQDLAQPEDEPIALMKYAQTYARELERIV